MPEGPSIILLKEETAGFAGKKVLDVYGNSKIDQERLRDKTVAEFKSWGKHFLICFKDFTLRIHFLMFGSYSINEKKPDRAIRLGLKFRNGEINFYACSVKYLEGDLDDVYDWSGDVMNPAWDAAKAKKKLQTMPHVMVCDALLDQDVFAGVGNIIKNEVLYRIRVHPESRVGKLSALKLNAMIKEAKIYSFEFLDWKRDYVLRKHWLAHTKTVCLRCNLPIIKKYTGVRQRRSFVCENCQKLYV
jgi:endonuclease-8